VSKTIDDACQLIETRLAEIHAEAKDLERALSGLGERTGRRASTRKRTMSGTPRRGSRSRRKAPKPAPRGERREQVLAALKATPGARPSELAATIGIRPTQVSVLIAKLRGERLIVKSGKGYALKS
jgi:hypothetical protein